MLSFLRNGGRSRKVRWLGCALSSLFFCTIALTGCNAPPKNEVESPLVKVEPVKPASNIAPELLLYEQLRSGAFQLSAAAGSIEDTLNSAREAATKFKGTPEARVAFEDVADFIDSAGEGVAEFAEEPPAKEDVAKNFAGFDDRRLKAIETTNDSLQDLREALGLLESLTESPNQSISNAALQVKALLAVAIDDVWGAVEALGGQPISQPGVPENP